MTLTLKENLHLTAALILTWFVPKLFGEVFSEKKKKGGDRQKLIKEIKFQTQGSCLQIDNINQRKSLKE